MIKGSLNGYDFLIDKNFEVECRDAYLKQLLEGAIMLWRSDVTIYGKREILHIVQRLKDAGATIEAYKFLVSDELEDDEYDEAEDDEEF